MTMRIGHTLFGGAVAGLVIASGVAICTSSASASASASAIYNETINYETSTAATAVAIGTGYGLKQLFSTAQNGNCLATATGHIQVTDIQKAPGRRTYILEVSTPTFKKQPLDVLDYDVDMSGWFSPIPADYIVSVDTVITSLVEEVPTLIAGPLPHVPVVLMGTDSVRFKVWLGGGTDFVDYKVTCVVTTKQYRKKEVDIKIKVRDK